MNEVDYKSINTNNDVKIIYCPQCDAYLVYSTTDHNHYYSCGNCDNTHTQNVFVDEAKIYFNPKHKSKRYIGANSSNIKIRHYSWKVITNLDS